MDADQVADKDQFLAFLNAMRDELQKGAERWQNVDLATFLEGMSSWVEDWEGPFATNRWQHAAALMRAGAFYE